jgi:purine-binding chemotaxis protein CheW
MNESTKSEDRQETRLEDQEQIVNQYLESLLSEVPEYGETEAVIDNRQDTAEIITISSPPEYVLQEVQQEIVSEQVQFLEEGLNDQEERPAPSWAQEPFQCLIMRVGELTLAIPLLAMDNIVKWDADLTPMPFQPAWHMGVLQEREHKVVVVDTSRLLLPEQAAEHTVTREQGSHILIIGDHHFGLACDSLGKPLIVHKEDVRWSIPHPDRLWMAGTVKEKLIVLVDIDALLQIIINRHE